jgi:hypothetical protein
MNSDNEYTLHDSYKVGGADNFQDSVKEFATKWIGGYPVYVLAILIILVLLVLWLLYNKKKEQFNPTQNLRDQDSDQFGLGRRERLTGRGASAFAQQVQTGGGTLSVDPNAVAGQPGSLGWQVLHSPDFACNSRKLVGDDAWAWMDRTAHETMQGEKPKTDNDFSKVLAGH